MEVFRYLSANRRHDCYVFWASRELAYCPRKVPLLLEKVILPPLLSLRDKNNHVCMYQVQLVYWLQEILPRRLNEAAFGKKKLWNNYNLFIAIYCLGLTPSIVFVFIRTCWNIPIFLFFQFFKFKIHAAMSGDHGGKK